jgi:hypothetical protein
VVRDISMRVPTTARQPSPGRASTVNRGTVTAVQIDEFHRLRLAALELAPVARAGGLS